MAPSDDYPEDSEVGASRVVHNHYTQSKSNGNDVNKVVWGVAAFAVICLVTINGIMWSKLWDMADSMARLETQMTMVLQRLPNP